MTYSSNSLVTDCCILILIQSKSKEVRTLFVVFLGGGAGQCSIPTSLTERWRGRYNAICQRKGREREEG